MESKYYDNKYLASYCLDSSFFDKYSIEVNDIVPLRNVYIIYTNSGPKILKKLSYSRERFQFIKKALDYVRSNYPQVIAFDERIGEEGYIEYNGDLYTIMDVISGRESEVHNPLDIEKASRAIGRLHLASLGLKEVLPKEFCKEENVLLGRFKTIVNKDIDFIYKLRDRVMDFKSYNEFDKLFIASFEDIEKDLYTCLELLNKSSYDDLCKDYHKIAFCHGDLAHHNMIINEEVWFLDFDYSTIDLRAKDLADFINKSIKVCAYDIDKCSDIIMNYEKEVPLSSEELRLLYIWLLYPRELISIFMGYYNKEKNWDYRTFMDRLKRKLQSRCDREVFLEEFSRKYLV